MSEKDINLETGLSNEERFSLLFGEVTRILLYLKHVDSDYCRIANALFESYKENKLKDLSQEYVDIMIQKIRELRL